MPAIIPRYAALRQLVDRVEAVLTAGLAAELALAVQSESDVPLASPLPMPSAYRWTPVVDQGWPYVSVITQALSATENQSIGYCRYRTTTRLQVDAVVGQGGVTPTDGSEATIQRAAAIYAGAIAKVLDRGMWAPDAPSTRVGENAAACYMSALAGVSVVALANPYQTGIWLIAGRVEIDCTQQIEQ